MLSQSNSFLLFTYVPFLQCACSCVCRRRERAGKDDLTTCKFYRAFGGAFCLLKAVLPSLTMVEGEGDQLPM